MPRTRLDKQPHPIAILINGYIFTQSGNLMVGSEKVGIPRSTLQRKLASPNTFTVDELLKIARAYHIPIDDVRAAIRL
jgi:hypothetical protein